MSETFFLSLILFLITDLGILVGFLSFGTKSPFFMISKNRFVTISLFFSWLLSSSHCKIKTKSAVNLEAKLDKGLLIIDVPTSEERAPKKIAINKPLELKPSKKK